MVASLISSSFFSFGLIVAGVAYTIFVGEPKSGTQRHAWWPYVAASVFAVCFAMMGSVALYGAYELQLRKAYAAGAAGLPRNDYPANPSRPQTPLYAEGYGELKSDQIRILLGELPKLRDMIPIVYLAWTPNDFPAYGLLNQFEDVFRRSGYTNIQRVSENPNGPDEVGLMIAVHDPNNIPHPAQKIMEAFEVADMRYKIITLPKGTAPDIQFYIFAGPRPIR
jgi:hypothetical protein